MKRNSFSGKQPSIMIAMFIIILVVVGFLISSATSCRAVAQTPTVTSSPKSPSSPQSASASAKSLSTVPQPAAIPSQGVTATMDDDNSLIFHIQGSVKAPGKVTVQYWSQRDRPVHHRAGIHRRHHLLGGSHAVAAVNSI